MIRKRRVDIVFTLSTILFVVELTLCISVVNAESRTQGPIESFVQIHVTQLPSNGRSCAECHAIPGIGGSSRITVTREVNTRRKRSYNALGSRVIHTVGSDAK